MEIKTYTNVWNADRKMYRFQDINLPMPISFKQIGLFGAGAIIWFPFMALFKVPIATSWGVILWFSIPLGLAWIGNKPIFGGKTIIQALGSFIVFLFEPPKLIDMEKPNASELEGVEIIQSEVWTKVQERREYPAHIVTKKQQQMYRKMEEQFQIWEQEKDFEGDEV